MRPYLTSFPEWVQSVLQPRLVCLQLWWIKGLFYRSSISAGITPLDMAHGRPSSNSEQGAIRKAVLDYVESCYSWEGHRMKRALHPKLAKRTAWTNPKTGRTRVYEYPASKLIHDVQAGWGGRRKGDRRAPLAARRAEVRILDRFKDMAVVRTAATWGVDYLSLAKVDGNWKIINVLWRHWEQ